VTTKKGISFREQIKKGLNFAAGSYKNNDKAHQFIINNGGSHVYHQHINPFQVQRKVGKNGYIAFETTWWDNLGNYGSVQTITARMWTRGYWKSPHGALSNWYFGKGGGLIIVHCHLLQHEDSGMMGFYAIRTFEMVPDEVLFWVAIVLIIIVVIIICILSCGAAHHFWKRGGSTENEKKLAEAHRTAHPEDVVHSGSIESATAGSTEMTTTAK